MEAKGRGSASRRQSREARQDEVVAAAAAVIARKGYHGTTIQDLAAELNVTPAGLYHYVQHKEHLLTEILERAGKRFHVAVKEIVDADMDAEPKMHLFFRRHLEMMIEQDRPSFTILFYERSLIPPDGLEELTAGEHASFATARRLIETVKEGNVDSRMATLAVLGMLNWVIRWYRDDGDYSVEEVADAFYEIFLHGIRPVAGGPQAGTGH